MDFVGFVIAIGIGVAIGGYFAYRMQSRKPAEKLEKKNKKK